MEMSVQRFHELGLGVDKESCLCCEECTKKNGTFFCGEMNIEDAEKNLDFAPCLDEERIRIEMSEDEYSAYRHGSLKVQKTGKCGDNDGK